MHARKRIWVLRLVGRLLAVENREGERALVDFSGWVSASR
jgi:hypothetical protein